MNEGVITLVLFDMGGTLIYSLDRWEFVMDAAQRALEAVLQNAGCLQDEKKKTIFRLEFRHRMEVYYLRRNENMREETTPAILEGLLKELHCPTVNDEVLFAGLDACYSETQKNWRLDPQAIPTLAELSRRGYRMGCISNAAYAPDVYQLLEKNGLRDFFEGIWISAEVGFRKPNPVIFYKALDFFDIAPSGAAMVGDSLPADVQGARNIGMKSIWITRNEQIEENQAVMDAVKPDMVIQSLVEIPSLLE